MDLEVRHRLRALKTARIRGLNDTGLPNLPLKAFVKNQIGLELACLAYELLKSTSAHVYVRQRIRLRAHLDMRQQGHRRTLRAV